MAALDDDKDSLDILVKQKISRPVYTRVISRELTKTPEEIKQSRKAILEILQTLNEDDEVPTYDEISSVENDTIDHEILTIDDEYLLSSDSEYYSASEDISDSTTRDDDSLELFDSNIDFVKDETQNPKDKSRRRRHSSKRKAKWHRQEKNKEMPFAGLTDDEFKPNLVEQITSSSFSSPSDMQRLQRPVPSLKEICAKRVGTIHSNIPRSSARDRLLGSHLEQKHAITKQLNRLHHILQFCEHQVQNSSEGILTDFDGKDKKGEWKTYYKFLLPRRNLWEKDNLDNWMSGGQSPERRGTRTFPCTNTFNEPKTNPSDALSALASLISLMLPNYPVLQFSGKDDKSDIQKLDNACYTVECRIQRHVKNRYPKLEEYMFKKALPYAWWARGNVRQAERTFMALIRQCSDVDEQVLILNEIARLHATCGNTHKCSKYLMAAVDVLSTDKKAMKCSADEEEFQSNVAHAVYMDSGVNTSGKAETCARLWDKLVHDEMASAECVQQAVTSLVCFHSAVNPGFDMSLWDQLDNKLKKIPNHQGDLALCLLYAMQGKSDESHNAFRTALYATSYSRERMFFDILPGRHFCYGDHRTLNPYESIVNQVKRSRSTIPPVKMIWRSRLTTPCMNFEHVHWSPGDFAYRNGSLWQCIDNSITGDMLMLLPPISAVKLCCYTGELKIGTYPEPLPLWKCTPRPSTVLKDKFLQIGSREIYSGTKGTFFLNVTTEPSWPNGSPYMNQCDAIYYGTDGSYSKINLKRLLRSCIKRKTEAQIRSSFNKKSDHNKVTEENQAYNRYVFNDKWLQDMHDTLADFDKHGRDISYEIISQNVKDKFWKKNPPKSDKKDKKAQARITSHKNSTIERLLQMQLSCYQTFGETVFLLFTVESIGSWQGHIIVIFNCESSFAFEEVKILHADEVVYGSFDKVNDLAAEWSCRNSNDQLRLFHQSPLFTIPKLEKDCHHASLEVVGLVATGLRHKRVYILNKQGDVLLNFEEAAFDETLYSNVIGQKLYGIHPDRKSIICSDCEKSITSGILPEIIDMTQVEDKLLVLTKKGICILDEEMNTIPWRSHVNSVVVSEDNVWLLGKFHKLSLVVSRCIVSSRGVFQAPVQQTLLAVENRVFLLESCSGSKSKGIHCILSLDVPGWTTEACFMSEEVGILVASTLMEPDGHDKFHEENVFQFNYRGELVGVLPGLGKGPHCFLPIYLPPNEQAAKRHPEMEFDKEAWYVYCRDGHGGISCFRPIQQE